MKSIWVSSTRQNSQSCCFFKIKIITNTDINKTLSSYNWLFQQFFVDFHIWCEGLTPYIHLAYHGLRVVRWSAKIAAANLAVFISIQKKIMFEWHTDKNQILWFVSLFAYVATLRLYLRSIERRPFNDITSQKISCWVEIRRTILLFMKSLVRWIWMLEKRNFWKKHSKVLYWLKHDK